MCTSLRSKFTGIFQYFLMFGIISDILVNCQILSKTEGEQGSCPLPENFPSNIKLRIDSYHSYSSHIKIPFAYVATPRVAEDIVTLANWAYLADFRVRAVGQRHSWSPLIFSLKDDGKLCPKIILVETTLHFTSLQLNAVDTSRPDLQSVTVGPGVTIQSLLSFLESHDLGLFSGPSIGSVTVGGMLAIGAHGTGAPSDLDRKSLGHTYGSFSNLVVEMTIIAWNGSSYGLKTITRADPEAKAFLTNLGRTFITSVTIRVGRDQNLRSQSYLFLPVKEVFGHPSTLNENSRSLSAFLESYGRISVIGFGSGPDSKLWVMTMSNAPIQPPKSRRVSRPFNYYFLNLFPQEADPLLQKLLTNLPPGLWKPLSVLGHPSIVAGTLLSRSVDFWGRSKNHLLYFSTNSPLQTPFSFVVVTSRQNLQLVGHILIYNYDALMAEFNYPVVDEFDIRITGVDDPKDVDIEGAQAPSFSNSRPVPEHPDYDLVVWLEFSSYKETPRIQEFMRRLQDLYYEEIHEEIGILRVEWSKAWANTDASPWTNGTILNNFPRVFSSSGEFNEWNEAVGILDGNDPHRIFSNDFLDDLLRKR